MNDNCLHALGDVEGSSSGWAVLSAALAFALLRMTLSLRIAARGGSVASRLLPLA